MRRLNRTEKDLCQLIHDSTPHTNLISHLFSISAPDSWVELDLETGHASVRQPTIIQDGIPVINVDFTNPQIEAYVSCVRLLELLENNGFIYLYTTGQAGENILRMGNYQEIQWTGSLFTDNNINQLAIRYRLSSFVVTQDFRNFVQRGFRTEEEVYNTSQLQLAYGNSIISAISAITAALALICTLLFQIFSR